MTDQTRLGLDAELYGEEGPIPEGEGPWEGEPPSDMGQVDWHLRRAAAYQAEIDRLDTLFKAEIERLAIRRVEALAELSEYRRWHVEAVEAWHRRARATRRVAKTLKFPHGVSKLTKSQIAAVVTDEEELRAWAVAHDLEEILWPGKPPPLSKKALKKAVRPADEKPEPGSRVRAVYPKTGEVVPGMEFQQSRDRHDVKEAE